MSYQRQKLKCLTLLTLLVMRSSLVRGEVFMSEEGGYNDVVIRISEDLDMNKCSNIINSLKVHNQNILNNQQFCSISLNVLFNVF